MPSTDVPYPRFCITKDNEAVVAERFEDGEEVMVKGLGISLSVEFSKTREFTLIPQDDTFTGISLTDANWEGLVKLAEKWLRDRGMKLTKPIEDMRAGEWPRWSWCQQHVRIERA